MTERWTSLSPIKWLGLVATVIALTNIAVFLDIPVLRQIFGFVFLTFVPGFLILSILKLNELGLTEKIVLSLGLSVSFLMLFGLIVNSASLALGYAQPLSTTPLLISFSLATFILAIVAYIRNKDIAFSLSSLRLTTLEKALLIVPSLFPVLSIVGMHIMNLTDNNVLLMLLLFLIPAYIIFISFYRHKVPQRLYPSLIYLISISLLLMLALRSSHITGSDIHDWYYTFQVTLDNSRWSILGPDIFDALLSISLLPSVYHIFLNINQEYLFKILYPLLFSISPLVVYIISKKYIGNFYALLASFFFMAQVTFLWTADAGTTNMAILFFALAIMVLFSPDVNQFAKKLLFIIFAASVVVSHYSTTYIVFFVLLLTWIGMQIIPRILSRERKAAILSENPIARSNDEASKSIATEIPQSQLKAGVTITIVALFLVVLFFWYSQITVASFSAGVGFIREVFANLSQWYVLELKGGTVTAALGKGIYMIPQQIRVVVSWLSVAFIVIGILSTVAGYKRRVAILKLGHIKPDFLQPKFEMEYFVLSLACSAILVVSVILPFVLKGYSMERTYFLLLTVLSPFFVIGGVMVAKWLRARPHWIILVVLIPFFMCTTGTMYQIFNVPSSMALNSAGFDYNYVFIHEQESYAAKWLKRYGEETALIYTYPGLGHRVAQSQGKISSSRIPGSFIPQYQKGGEIKGYIYLRYVDITMNKVVTEYPDIFAGKNKIYATNGSEIYQ